MKLDRILAKIFSRVGALCATVFLTLSVLFMSACDLCDVFLCLYCGCLTPDTCMEVCDCVCFSPCQTACDGLNSCTSACYAPCSDGCHRCIFRNCYLPSQKSDDSDGGYATDEEFYEWLEQNGY